MPKAVGMAVQPVYWVYQCYWTSIYGLAQPPLCRELNNDYEVENVLPQKY